MRWVAGVEEVRRADASASARVGEQALIARAAQAVATVSAGLLGRVYGARVVVVAGSGHNGADALRAGRLLAGRGAHVVVVRSSEREGDELWRWAAAGLRVRADLPPAADLVLDGMTGIGGSGALRGRAAELARALGGLGAVVVAVDLPSGVDAGTGAVAGPVVRADVTVTFDRHKPGHLVGAGAGCCGEVVVADVGLDFPAELAAGVCDADDVARLLPTPPSDSDKYTRGVVAVVAGSAGYSGAAILCTGGAVRAGAGYVRYEGTTTDAVRAAWPTAVVGTGRVDAYACGPGMDDSAAAVAAIRRVVESGTAAVLDAGALDLGADALRGRTAPTLITPHAGEFRRLTGIDPAADPLGSARRAAADLGVHVLLKGERTVVAAPDGRARVNPTGTTWLSTAGTGDVLSGAAGALLAAEVKRAAREHRDPDLLAVGAGAAFLHGLAGRYCPVPLSATDLLEHWAEAVAAVRGG